MLPKGMTAKEMNDGSGLIRGFVAFEFVDDNGNVCYKNREIAFIPKADQFTGISADYWIPPGKNAIFICNVPDGVLKLNNIFDSTEKTSLIFSGRESLLVISRAVVAIAGFS